MEIWVIITLVAAFFQNIRSSLQKHLKGVLSTSGATFVRFGYGVPFAICFLIVFLQIGDHDLPVVNQSFLFWVVVASLAQIIAQALLVHMFSLRNFTVGSAYSRTEPVQAALFGLIFFSESISAGSLIAIGISVFGVMLISVARIKLTATSLVTSVFSKTALIGLTSGTFFGISAVGYRGASLSLDGPNFIVQAAMTLTCAIILQTCILLIWIKLREPGQLAKILQHWKVGLIVGFVGAAASFGWFMAFTLQQAALVKAVAKVEMIFTFLTTVFVFKEHINRLEILGCLFIGGGIVALILFA